MDSEDAQQTSIQKLGRITSKKWTKNFNKQNKNYDF
jgi:hypothetical protein